MPTRVIPQSHDGAGTASASQARVAGNSVAGDPASGEGPARKRLQKTGPAEMTTTSKRSAFPISRTSAAKSATERTANPGRRKSVREPKAPLGPRPSDYLPSKSDNTYNPSHLPSGSFAASQSSTSLRSNVETASTKPRGGNTSDVNKNDSELESGSVDLLPTVNFDELHHSIKSNDFELSQATPVVEGAQHLVGGSMADVGSMPFEDRQRGIPVNSQPGRVGRSGSILRRQTNGFRENHQAGLGLTGSAFAASDTLHVASRLRGENQAQLEKRRAVAYRNRKSVGPGVLDYAVPGERGQPNRPAVGTAGVATNAGERTIPFSAEPRQTVRAGSLAGLEQPRLVAISRNAKAKSFHPTARDGSAEVAQPLETLELQSSSAVPVFARSLPWNPHSLPTSSSMSSLNRRMSMIPPHATGLGARTISPTDARRMQRMSMLPDRPPMPDVPTTPQPDVGGPRSAAHSPSMIPRKSVTPSSSRNTPDVSRRFHTHGAQASSGVMRNLAGGLPPRLSQTSSTSRLPTLKTRNVHSPAGGEEVPPVPAIPKAYESPRETVERPFFSHGSSISAFGSASAVPAERATHGLNSKALSGTDADSFLRPGSGFDPGNSAAVASSLKNRGHLQPLRLPPLNVLPLSGSTVERVAALQDPAGESSEGRSTPHPKRGPKTPSTPMTASKAGFFSKVKAGDEPSIFGAQSRSNSSNLLKGSDASLRETNASSSHALSNEGLAPQSIAFGSHPVSGDVRSTRPAGPRAPTFRETDGSPQQKPASPATLTAPSAPSSLRRKWSLSFRRSSSKASNQPGEPEPTQAPPPSKHELMPPPRLPASVTFPATSASTPSPTNYLMSNTEQRFRKSSATSLLSGLERAPGNNWSGPPKVRDASKEIEQRAHVMEATRAATRAASVTLSSAPRAVSSRVPPSPTPNKDVDPNLDPEDIAAEMEMKKLVSRRRDIELAAHEMDDLRRRAVPKEKITPAQALRLVRLNIFERGEIVDYKDIYFCGAPGAKKHVGDLNSPPTNFGYDDERGDYIIVKGDHLAYRYEVIDVLGKGSFGQVVRCVDHKNGGLVAVKIIRNKKRFHQQALIEVNILRKLREWDPDNKHGMVNFTQSFYFRGHLCISTELLGMNLYEFIKYNNFHGFSLKLIRRFTKQLLSSLILLHGHRIIHCDLKPENVLLAHPGHSEIKVIDFGSSCFETEKVYTYIQSRFYRSPEVILGMTYGMPIDIWSLGCILAELYTGSPIFPGENEQEQLACIMEVFGPPEKHLIEKSTRKKLFFDSNGKPRTVQFSKGRRRRPSSKTLQQVLRCDDDAFMDFIARCLRWDPERRLKPDEAMRHEFITGIKKPPPPPRNRAGAAHAAHAAHHAAGGPAAGDASASAIGTFRRPGAMQAAAASAVAAPSALRPLPDPPATYFKHNAGAARTRDARATGSPTKAAAAARRHSTVHGMQANAGVKRTSTGAPVGSALPRVGPRASLANKGELATAAAATASIAV